MQPATPTGRRRRPPRRPKRRPGGTRARRRAVSESTRHLARPLRYGPGTAHPNSSGRFQPRRWGEETPPAPWPDLTDRGLSDNLIRGHMPMRWGEIRPPVWHGSRYRRSGVPPPKRPARRDPSLQGAALRPRGRPAPGARRRFHRRLVLSSGPGHGSGEGATR